DVAKIRSLTKDREEPWTIEQLKNFDLPLLTDRKLWKANASIYPKPQNAIDGKRDGGHTSSWHGQNTPGCWFAVDLGKPYRLTQLVLDSFYEDRYPRAYMIQVSNDGKTWSQPIAEGKGEGIFTHVTFEPVVARYFKITETGTAIE